MNGNFDAESNARGIGNLPCPNCHAEMPSGLRFCRMCGFRLGEGVEEYTATRRFDGTVTKPAGMETNNLTAGRQFVPPTWEGAPPFSINSLEKQPDSSMKKMFSGCSTKRINWFVWAIVLAVVLTIAGVSFRAVRINNQPPPPPTSFLGVDGFETADGGGAFIEGIAGVGSPIENAGLIGGDVIINFDGQKIEDDDDMSRMLRKTPIGKAVEVVFVRDGVTKTTTLTSIAQRDFPGMSPLDARPGGKGKIGVDTGDRKRVPSLNTYGVELDDVNRNEPADLAGLKRGDIVIDFAGYAVRTPGDLRYRIYQAVPGSIVPVVVIRGNERIAIDMKVGRSKD
jgi:membrane-associated protease RseP (regulator of RpoE activity)